jgi:hypothetical protein
MVVLFATLSITQTAPDTLWTKTINGYEANFAQQTHDGGLIILTDGGDVIRFNESGDTLWTERYRCPGGGGMASFPCSVHIKETSDLGFIMSCCINHYFWDDHSHLFKINSAGDSLWLSVEVGACRFEWIEQTSDQGYIVTGGFFQEEYGDIIKFSEIGDTLWTRNRGGNCIKQTPDKGYIMTGTIPRSDESPDRGNAVLFKINEMGDSLWKKIYNRDDLSREIGKQILLTSDNGYIILSEYWYTDQEYPYSWLIKTNESGDTTWTKSLNVGYNYIQQTTDKGFILIGDSEEKDLWIIKLSENGYTQWTKTLNNLCGVFIEQTSDNGYIAVAHTSPPADIPTLIIRLASDPLNIEINPITFPNQFRLYQNYPNPFNPSTQISFNLPKPEFVTLEIYNTLGQKIETLLNKAMKAGQHEVEFNAQNLSSGIYFYRIEAGEFQDVKKMVLLR